MFIDKLTLTSAKRMFYPHTAHCLDQVRGLSQKQLKSQTQTLGRKRGSSREKVLLEDVALGRLPYLKHASPIICISATVVSQLVNGYALLSCW